MRLSFIKCHGSGNDFGLVDARSIALDQRQWAAVARAISDRAGPVGSDGILLLTEGGEGFAVGYRMFNPDGSESETCVNGLRLAGRLAFEQLGVDRIEFRMMAGSAEAWREDAIGPGVATVGTRVGPASIDLARIGLGVAADAVIEAEVPGLPSARTFTAVAMPNPHLVAFVDAIDEAELVALGDWCEAGPELIPGRANVSFAVVEGGGLFVRTYERGVGLTDSCGSAMAAATHAACLTGRKRWGEALTVRNRGGFVRVTAEGPDKDNWVRVAGNSTFLYDAEIEIDLATGRADAPLVHHRREDEARAWETLVAATA